MKISKYKIKVFSVLLLAIFIPIAMFSIIVYTASMASNSESGHNIINLGFIAVIILGFLFSLVCFLYINKLWSKILYAIKNLIKAGEETNCSEINLLEDDEYKDIKYAFCNMTQNIKKSRDEIEEKVVEIYLKKIELEYEKVVETFNEKLQSAINQLDNSEKKYHSLVENLTDIVCVINLDGRIFFINDTVKSILGYSKYEVEGKSFNELIKPDIADDFFERISSILNDKNSMTVELELKSKDGNPISTEATLTNFIVNGEIIGIQAILRNVTEKKKVEKEVIASYQDLSTLNNISKRLNSTIKIHKLERIIVEEISRALKNPFCSLRLVDDSGKKLVPKAFAGSYFEGKDCSLQDFATFELDDPFCEKAFNSNEPIVKRNLDANGSEGNAISDIIDVKKIKEIMFVPIKLKNKKIGLITVGTSIRFNIRQKNLLSSAANIAANSLENARLYNLSRQHFVETVNALIAAIEAKDKYTEGHSFRVSKYAVILAENLGLSKEHVDEIRIAGILHDVGKIGIPDAILSKPGKLSEEEFELVKKHPKISNRILESVGLSERTLNAIAYHHERWDGKGYPFGINNEELSIEAQIISVADAFDAMTSNRAYRAAMSEKDALKEIIRNKDSQFSPSVVNALEELLKTVEAEDFVNEYEQQ